MKIELTEEQKRYKAEFKAFTDEYIMPYAGKFDREECLSAEIIDRLREKSYLGSMLPKEYGGMGIDMVTIGLLNEEIGRGCSSVRSLLTVHGMAALALLRWGTPAQKEYWLPKLAAGEVIGAFGLTEPNAGSNAKGIEAKAELQGDYYILKGRKKWITMGQIADVFIVFAKCEDKPTAFIVEKNNPGFSTEPIRGLLGMRACMAAELYLDDCRIPKENLLGSIGTGMSHVALSCLDYGRYTIAWGCVGVAQACLEQSLSYAGSRKQFGKVLGDNQLIQKMIAHMVVNVKAARLMCCHAGYLKDIGDPDCIYETWSAKYFASTLLNKIASDAVQIHGANGCHSEYPVERYFRDAKINEIIEGTTQIHEILLASNALQNM